MNAATKTPDFKFRVKTTSDKPTVSHIRPRSSLQAPIVCYTPHVKAVIDMIVDTCKEEAGWLGLVKEMPYGYLVHKIYIPKQEVSATTTEIDADAMSALALEIMDAGDDPNELRYWGHSHVDMGVSPSRQDEDQVEEYLDNCELFIRGIYNKRGDSKVDVYDLKDGVAYECVRNGLETPILSEADKKNITALITKNVTKAPRVISYGSGANWRDNFPSGNNLGLRKPAPSPSFYQDTTLDELGPYAEYYDHFYDAGGL